MLRIVIPFEGSWTNSFLDENHEPRFTSGKALKAGITGLEPVAIPAPGAPNTSMVEAIRALNRANPSMTYKVPENYDNTVKGILARLMGEVRRLSDLEEDHPIHDLFSDCTYAVDISSEHEELTALATPPNPIQTGGAGVMPAGNALYEKTALAYELFGHLGCTMPELLEGRAPQKPWVPAGPVELAIKLQTFKAQQDALVKSLQKQAKKEEVDYVSPFTQRALEIKKSLASLSDAPDVNEDIDSWNWAGAVIVQKVHCLQADTRQVLVENGVFSKNGNLSGLSMSGAIGRVTEKDLYEKSGAKKAYSTRMPFRAALWYETDGKKAPIAAGVIKKNGCLTIQLNIDEERARAVNQRIEDAAVGPFHFGKKGVAYVARCYIS